MLRDYTKKNLNKLYPGYDWVEPTEYYSATPKNCPYAKLHGGKCHEQRGGAGYICKYFVDFYCGDDSLIICSRNKAAARVVQLTLF